MFFFGLDNEGKIGLLDMILFFCGVLRLGSKFILKISIKDGKEVSKSLFLENQPNWVGLN